MSTEDGISDWKILFCVTAVVISSAQDKSSFAAAPHTQGRQQQQQEKKLIRGNKVFLILTQEAFRLGNRKSSVFSFRCVGGLFVAGEKEDLLVAIFK